MITTTLRILLTAFLLYKAYPESGPWTTGILVLIAFSIELEHYATKSVIELIMKNHLKDITTK